MTPSAPRTRFALRGIAFKTGSLRNQAPNVQTIVETWDEATRIVASEGSAWITVAWEDGSTFVLEVPHTNRCVSWYVGWILHLRAHDTAHSDARIPYQEARYLLTRCSLPAWERSAQRDHNLGISSHYLASLTRWEGTIREPGKVSDVR